MDYTGKPVIYEIRNLQTGAFYIGSTIQLKLRWAKHRRELRAGKHHCPHLQNAWIKYGEAAFTFSVVQVVATKEELLAVEQQWLDEFHGTEKCYNYAKYVDNGNRGIKFQRSHCSAISAGLKTHYEKNGARSGWTHTDEVRAQISAKKAGVAKTEEHKEKLRLANLGKTASAETRARLSARHKGRVKSDAWVAKYNKQIVERTSGVVYASLKAAKEAYGISPGSLNNALKAGCPIKKGPHKGLWFAYAVT